MEAHQKLTSSIAMCTYNGAKYLEEQLQSFVEQTRLPDELIVCDDCSSDNTMEILHRFAQTAPFPVTVIQNEENLGYTANFLKCASLCHNDVIFFSDQDDVWDVQKIETFMNRFESSPEVGMVLSDVELMDVNGHSLNSSQVQQATRRPIAYWLYLSQKNQMHFFTKYPSSSWPGMAMAYRNVYSDFLYKFNKIQGHDRWLLCFFCIISKIQIIPQQLTKYRIHHNNADASDTRTMIKQTEQANSRKIIDRYRTLSEDFQNMVSYLSQSGLKIEPQALKLLAQKSEHLMTRYKIRTKQVNKWYYILRETFNGNYFRFGLGIYSIGMDVLN